MRRRGRQEEVEGRDVTNRGESRSELDYRKDDPDKWNIRQFLADEEKDVPSLPSNVD